MFQGTVASKGAVWDVSFYWILLWFEKIKTSVFSQCIMQSLPILLMIAWCLSPYWVHCLFQYHVRMLSISAGFVLLECASVVLPVGFINNNNKNKGTLFIASILIVLYNLHERYWHSDDNIIYTIVNSLHACLLSGISSIY